jgi:hypothetical protein
MRPQAISVGEGLVDMVHVKGFSLVWIIWCTNSRCLCDKQMASHSCVFSSGLESDRDTQRSWDSPHICMVWWLHQILLGDPHRWNFLHCCSEKGQWGDWPGLKKNPDCTSIRTAWKESTFKDPSCILKLPNLAFLVSCEFWQGTPPSLGVEPFSFWTMKREVTWFSWLVILAFIWVVF